MKPVHFLPPAVALVVAILWIGGQKRSIARLHEESEVLRVQIAEAKERASSNGGVEAERGPAAVKEQGGEFDWKEIAGKVLAMQRSGRMGNMRTFLELQEKLMSMSGAELAALLDEINGLGLTSDERGALEGMLIGPLIEKDPKLALERFIDRAQDVRSGMSWQLSRAMGKWATEDLAAATAWFDKQLAAGVFETKALDGNREAMTRFEASLLGPLLASDPGAAAARLEGMSAEEIQDVFQGAGNGLDKDRHRAYADLLRQKVEVDDSGGMIADFVAGQARSEGYQEASECLDRIAASPDERSASVGQVAESRFQTMMFMKKPGREDIDELRTWAESEVPGSADEATGRALEGMLSAGNRADFSEVAELATHYVDAGGSDAVLEPLLRSYQAQIHEDEAMALLGKISDEELRAELEERLK